MARSKAGSRDEPTETANLLAAIVEGSDDAILGKDLDGRILSWNKAAGHMYGYSPEEIIGKHISVLSPPEDKDAHDRILERIKRGEKVAHFETERVRKDGTRVWVSLTVSPTRDSKGQVNGASIIAREISERRRLDEELRAASLYTRNLIEASLDPLVTISADGKITDVNKATEQVTGVTRKRLIGSDFSDYFTEPDKARAGYEEVFSKGVVRDYPLTIRHSSGRAADVLYNASVYKDEEGQVQGAFAAARDITERRRVEEATSLLAAIVEGSDDAILGKDLDGRILSWNRAAEHMYGYGADEIIGKHVSLLYPPEDKGAHERIIERIKRGEKMAHVETERVRKGGTRVWVSLTISPTRDSKGQVNGASIIARDITERRRLDEELRAASLYTRNLIEASLDPLVTIDPEGKITDVNKATEQVTGVSRKRLIASDFSDYFTEPDKARAGYEEVFSKGVVRDYPLTIRHSSGRTTDVLYNASVYKNEAGEVQGVFAAARDITERKRMEGQLQEHAALRTSQLELAEQMRGDPPLDALCRKIITYLCKRLDVPTGLFYLTGDDGTLRLAGSYAHKRKKHAPIEFKPGEGLVGQAALEKRDILLSDVPEDYITIESGLGETAPRHIYAKPIVWNDEISAVIELGTLHELAESQSSFLDTVAESIAVSVESAEARTRLADSLEESQALAEELQAQQEELRTANEELEEQTQALTASEEQLRAQQEELQVTNEELEEKNTLLDRQRQDVEHARKEVEEKAEQLALASKYKSEFLANMSHELRTPLNSLLLLAQGLTQNVEANMTADQVESARIIYGSGSDLLNLINEILDLSKIEAGRMDLELGTVRTTDLAEGVIASFAHMAEDKGLQLEVRVLDDAPAQTTSDRKRIEQVIRNLLSNAIKFTDSGGVTVTFGRPSPGTALSRTGLSPDRCLAIEIKDTGVGIALGHLKVIFEAFQQIDGGTARRYGGTGLGLSISRELAHLLGGEIGVVSEPGQGSTFTLYIPSEPAAAAQSAPVTASAARATEDLPAAPIADPLVPARALIEDDREDLDDADRVVLVIEDDPRFARLLYKKCHEKGLKCIAAPTGESGLELAGRHMPAAVILDIHLPGMDGWAVLDALKEDMSTRHIPVHVMSVEEASTEALRKGAIGHATKPLTDEDLEEAFRRLDEVLAGSPGRVLVVEDDPSTRRETVRLIKDRDVDVDEAATGQEALAALLRGGYDCVVLDLALPDMDGSTLLDRLAEEGVTVPPVIVHTALEIGREEEAALREHAESIVVKDVRSQERLLDEVCLFLHKVVSDMPAKKRQMIRDLHDKDALLRGKKVLIVDDDMRTTFAVSRLLSQHGMETLKADNGERALRELDEQPDVDLVLMDIMMPVMDGYETMRRIRDQERFRGLPVIALTAKAMPEDRDKCVEAGASDYLPKPVDQERLISMMRVWLHR